MNSIRGHLFCDQGVTNQTSMSKCSDGVGKRVCLGLPTIEKTAVGCARGGCAVVLWQGETTQRGPARRAEQRGQSAAAQPPLARGASTQKVVELEGEILSIHQVLSAWFRRQARMPTESSTRGCPQPSG